MACYSSLILLLAAILLFSLASANVDETCKAANNTVEYNFCASSLRTNPRSETADAKELALIGTQLCLHNATGVRSKMASMTAEGNLSRPVVKEILETCKENVFQVLINMSTTAVDAVKSGNYTGALKAVVDIVDHADDCAFLFYEGATDDLIANDEVNLQRLATLAAFLIGRVG